MQENCAFTLINCKVYRDNNNKSPFLFAQFKYVFSFCGAVLIAPSLNLVFSPTKMLITALMSSWVNFEDTHWGKCNNNTWRWAYILCTFGELTAFCFHWCYSPFLPGGKQAFWLQLKGCLCSCAILLTSLSHRRWLSGTVFVLRRLLVNPLV